MSTAKILMVVGATVFALGLVLNYLPGLFSWVGRLPGDIRWGDENRVVFIPITSMVVISLILSLLLNWWLRR